VVRLSQNKNKRVEGLIQVVESLPSTCGTLGSISATHTHTCKNKAASLFYISNISLWSSSPAGGDIFLRLLFYDIFQFFFSLFSYLVILEQYS
jgi:hypothetical protein